MQGKTAIVTGAARGIGLQICRRFCAEGARVLMVDVDAKALTEAAAEIDGSRVFVADVTDQGALERAVESAVAWGGSVEFAVANAGLLGPIGPIESGAAEDAHRVLDVTLHGAYLLFRAVLPRMRSGAVCVAVSSVNGLRSAPNAAAYSAAKHGLVGLVRAVALDYAAAGIRCCAVCPGAVDTDMLEASFPGQRQQLLSTIPLGRTAGAEDIAGTVQWLCSEEADYVTGTTLVVDGGILAS